MSKLASFVLSGMAALVLCIGAARAEASDAKADKPTAAEKSAKVAPPLTDDGLKVMLENLGYEPRAEKLEKTVIYHLTIDQDGWTFYVDVTLSNDKEQLWITTTVATLPADEKVPAETLLKLLAETNDIGPSAVYYDKLIKRVGVGLALTNRGGLTPAVVRTHLNQFLVDSKAVQKLCDFPKAEAKKVTETDEKNADKK